MYRWIDGQMDRWIDGQPYKYTNIENDKLERYKDIDNPDNLFQADNFVLSAVFCAIEEDNHAGLEELLAMANIDITQEQYSFIVDINRYGVIRLKIKNFRIEGAFDNLNDSLALFFSYMYMQHL